MSSQDKTQVIDLDLKHLARMMAISIQRSLVYQSRYVDQTFMTLDVPFRSEDINNAIQVAAQVDSRVISLASLGTQAFQDQCDVLANLGLVLRQIDDGTGDVDGNDMLATRLSKALGPDFITSLELKTSAPRTSVLYITYVGE